MPRQPKNLIEKLALGTAQFGLDYGIANRTGKISKNEIFRILEYAYTQGIDTIDTSSNYGESEKIIGEFIDRSRFDFKIVSKFTCMGRNGHKNIKTLIEKNLVKIMGRRETVGRPIIYGTSQEFLQYFGLNSLEELPKLEEFHFTEKDIELPEHLQKEEDELEQREGGDLNVQVDGAS